MVIEKDSGPAEESTDKVDPFADFLDIPMQVRAELGSCRRRCSEVVALRAGSVITLPRSAGDNVALLLNGLRIGAGEIVVIEDSMGLRITEIVGHKHGVES
ncbi:MAG: FliM/FliN family flagellar motor switch protein [Acidobacteria bacterium]|nr:FliM/FliN family flagellar motor switch protein [Acidobacteriota bacterium]